MAAFGATLPLQDIADTRWRDLSLTSDEAAIQTGTLPVVPLVLRANAGDCLSIMLRNDLPALAKNQLIDFKWGAGQTRVRITPPLLLFDPQGSYGAAIGLNLELTTLFLNFANESQQMHGSFGAIIAEPAGSTYTNLDGSASSGAGLQLDIHNSARYSDRLAAGVFSFDAHCWPFEPLLSGSQVPCARFHAAQRNRRRTRHRRRWRRRPFSW